MSNERTAKKIDFSFTSISRLVLLLVVVIFCYSCAFFIPIVFLYEVIKGLHFNTFLNLFILSVSVVISYLILVFSMILFSTFFIRVLRLKYTEGVYETTIKDKTSFKFILSYALYFPTYKVIGFMNMPPVKVLFLKMIGCKIGKNVVLAADEWIFDPYVTEIGDNTTIGGRAIITGHIGEGGRVYIKKVKIGNMVLIGGDVMIMPGVTIEDNVIVGAKSLVLKDQVLKQGKMYAGVPAREISTPEKAE
jgi:acetyltransferase-like isoleucine patch superfamily enzyme